MTSADIPVLIEKTRSVMLDTLKDMSKPAKGDITKSPLLSGNKPISYDAVDKKDKKDGGEAAAEAVAGTTSQANGTTDAAAAVDDDATEVATEADAATEVGSILKTSPKSDKLTIA